MFRNYLSRARLCTVEGNIWISEILSNCWSDVDGAVTPAVAAHPDGLDRRFGLCGSRIFRAGCQGAGELSTAPKPPSKLPPLSKRYAMPVRSASITCPDEESCSPYLGARHHRPGEALNAELALVGGKPSLPAMDASSSPAGTRSDSTCRRGGRATAEFYATRSTASTT